MRRRDVVGDCQGLWLGAFNRLIRIDCSSGIVRELDKELDSIFSTAGRKKGGTEHFKGGSSLPPHLKHIT